MKVLQINAVNQIGSAGRTSRELHAFLKERGVRCVTAYAQGGTPAVCFDATAYAEACRANVLQNFDAATNQMQYFRLFQRLTDKGGRA